MTTNTSAIPALAGLSCEWQESVAPRPEIGLIVFDFDGTLSWLRHGWPGFMSDVFRENYPFPLTESEAALRSYFLHEILALNGKPSIYQCQRFVDLVQERGGPLLEAEALRAEFQRRLDEAIASRMEAIRAGTKPASDYVIHGAYPFLERLAAKGITLAILSTTVQERVVEEADLLGIGGFFGRHIYGGTGDPLRFSKRAIFDRLLAEEGIPGARLLSFGDGPVELRDTKELGGLGIAVCSDEDHNGSGLIDPHKRITLFAAGAAVAIPDYRDAGALLDFLLGQ